MNYQRHYDLLIDRARSRILEGYVERHHVIPKCMGGSDDPENIVQLTPEEHFVAHVLLVKIYPEERNLIFAVSKMCRGTGKRNSRKMYGWLRRKWSERMSVVSSNRERGSGNSQFGTKYVHNSSGWKKLKRGEQIPDGWFPGQKPKPVRMSKDEQIAARRISAAAQGAKKAAAVNARIEESLQRNSMDMELSLIELGYKSNPNSNSTKGYSSWSKFEKIRNALVSAQFPKL